MGNDQAEMTVLECNKPLF